MDDGAADDESYPAAPQPAHERTWRHPSEIGQATWRQNEPPIAIGRSLLFTTGALGGLLALAVLWATLPTGAGGGGAAAVTTVSADSLIDSSAAVRTPAATAGESSLESTATIRASRSGSDRATTTVDLAEVDLAGIPTAATDPGSDPTDTASLESIAAGTLAPTTLAPSTASSTSAPPASSASTPATTIPTASTIGVDRGSGTDTAAIAVAVGTSQLVITTASAVEGRATVMLSYSTGRTSAATVVMVDKASGLAVLAPETLGSTSNFPVAAAPKPGETFTVLAGTSVPTSKAVSADGSLDVTGFDADTPEGTPVVNGSGALLGLCSHGSKGLELVLVGDLTRLRAAVDALAGTSTTTTAASTTPVPTTTTAASTSTTISNPAASAKQAWMGVQFNADPTGSLTVNYVDPAGPAGSAGIAAGDTILAIDGVALASSSDVSAALAAHAPGDTMRVNVRRAGGAVGTSETVTVTLAERTATL